MRTAPPTIVFLTDFGSGDGFVGTCHGVMDRIGPGTRIIDLDHQVERGDIRAGALILAHAIGYMPSSVYLAVVDAGDTRAVAVRAGGAGRVFVGPDNGLLAPAITRAGGAVDAVEISQAPCRLEPSSPTFRGRDIFAPVAANLALGAGLRDLGAPVDVAGLADLQFPPASEGRDSVTLTVLLVDRCGNLATNADDAVLDRANLDDGAALDVSVNGTTIGARVGRVFGDVPDGELLVYRDPNGRVGLAAHNASAAQLLAAGRDDTVRLTFRS
ncbi:MAG: SAM hydrolase/SAM-dependent halogenase family protein [Solirubrobacterales bacterium]